MELIATRMAVINKGKTVAQGELKTLLNDENRIVRIQTDRVVEAEILVKQSPKWNLIYKGIDEDGLSFQIHLEDIPKLNLFFIENGFQVFALESRRQLEDYFLKMTESAERMPVL
jgi:ABC-type multidrug transport system ATPase subunit